jgi:sec-independent protein translocase protein TatB
MLPGVGFPEFLIVCVVALVVIGPRDLPKLARMAAGYIKQARGLAREFQKSFDEMGRTLELEELRKEVDALKRGDPLKDVTNELKALERDIKAVDQPSIAAQPLRHPAIGGPGAATRPAAAPAPLTPAAAPSASTQAAAPAPDRAEPAPPREDRKLSGT